MDSIFSFDWALLMCVSKYYRESNRIQWDLFLYSIYQIWYLAQNHWKYVLKFLGIRNLMVGPDFCMAILQASSVNTWNLQRDALKRPRRRKLSPIKICALTALTIGQNMTKRKAAPIARWTVANRSRTFIAWSVKCICVYEKAKTVSFHSMNQIDWKKRFQL